LIVRFAVYGTAAVGLKVMLTLQEAAIAKVLQLFVCAKGATTEILETVTGVVRRFVNVIVCGALVVFVSCELKVRVAGERFKAVVPVPVRLTLCGLPAASSVMEIVACRAPATVGLKIALIMQDAFAASEDPQLLVCVKSATPVMPMLEMVSGTFCSLFNVND